MENQTKITFKGHTITGSARQETAGTDQKWRPDNPTVDGQTVIFDPLNFPNRKFDTEKEAIQHSLKYAEWIVEHPLALRAQRTEDEDEEEDKPKPIE